MLFHILLPFHVVSLVSKLNKKRFNEIINKKEDLFVQFYTPWCGYCKELFPIYKELEKRVEGIAHIKKVNCDEERDLCLRNNIEGYPTLIFFKKGKKIQYKGERNIQGLVSFVKKNAKNFIRKISSKEIEKCFTLSENKPQVILFSKTEKESFLFRRVSGKMSSKANFLQIKTKKKEILSHFGISSLPSVVGIYKKKFCLLKGKGYKNLLIFVSKLKEFSNEKEEL